MTTADLRLDEANELLAAWSCAQAEARDIRVLIIKGRVLADDGLRRPRTSSDVDLLVEPTRFDEYCAAIVEAGWDEFPSTFASSHFTRHSRSFRKQGWPNSFDVHSEYPGFLLDPGVAFDALWGGRRARPFAHRLCPVPSRPGGALILALHSLRGTRTQSRHESELGELASAVWTEDERRDLAALASATGSAGPLRATLAGWGVEVEPDPNLDRAPASLEWRRKTSEAQGAAVSWLFLLRSARWRDKPEVVGRALWPSHDDFRRNHPEVPDRPWPQLRARAARWGRGFSRLPDAIRAILQRD